jgi:hypothetical protein
MKTAANILKNVVWALPLLILSSCFDDGDGYTNVVIPGVVFDMDSLSGDTLYFDSPSKSSKTILIKTNQRDWTSFVVSGSDFCSTKKAGGLSISVTENEVIAVRTAEISMRAGGESYRMFVHQKEAAPFLRIGSPVVGFDSVGVETVAVRSNFDCEAASNADWCAVTKQPSATVMESTITITVSQKNPTATPREAEITFTSQTYPEAVAGKKVTVKQS